MTRFTLIFLLVGACASETGTRSGTSVGNPTKVGLTAARTDGVVVTDGILPTTALVLDGCDGSTGSVALTNGLALGETVVVPAGTWCAQSLVDGGPLVLDAVTDGTPFSLVVDVPDIVLAGTWTVRDDGSRYLVELGQPGWLAQVRLEVADGTLHFGADHPLAASLTAAVVAGTGLFRDADGDGDLGDDEREPLSDGERAREAACEAVWESTYAECMRERADERECDAIAGEALEDCLRSGRDADDRG